jgi:hypothetical protein
VSKGLAIGVGLIVLTTTGALRPVAALLGIEGYTGFVIATILFWISIVITAVSAIRLAGRSRTGHKEN